MSIARAITDLQDRVEGAYDAVEEMGGTIPATKNTANLSAAIESIPSGGLPWTLIDTCSTITNPDDKILYNEDVRYLRSYGLAFLYDRLDEINLPNLQGLASGNPPAPSTTGFFTSAINATNPIKIIFPKYESTYQTTVRIGFTSKTRLKHLDIRSVTGRLGGASASAPRVFGDAPLEFCAWGVDTLKAYSFYECTTLKELVLPKCDKGIEDNALVGCTNLERLTIAMPYNADFRIYGTSALTNLKYVCFGKISTYSPLGTAVYRNFYLTFPYCETFEFKSLIAYNPLGGLSQTFSDNPTLKHLVCRDRNGIPCNFGNNTSLAAVDLYTAEDGDDTKNKCLLYLTYDAYTFKNCTALKRVNVHNAIQYVGNNINESYVGVTNCHFWFYKTTALNDWSGDGFVNRWKSFITSRSDAEFSHTNVAHFPLRGTKIIWSENDNDWVEVEVEEPYQPSFTRFTAEEANSQISMAKYGNHPPLITLKYSTDGNTWKDFIPEQTTITLANVGDYVLFKAGENGNTSFAKYTVEDGLGDNWYFVMSGKISGSGSIMSLLNGEIMLDAIYSAGAFALLFDSCSSLTKAPDLTATTLSPHCYQGLFYGCSNLKYIKYDASSWGDNATYRWVREITAQDGTFVCPAQLGTNSTIERGVSQCPEGWTVINDV